MTKLSSPSYPPLKQKLLIRAGRPPHDETSNEAALAWRGGGHFASNTGNMLYSDSVYRALNTPHTTLVCDAYAPQSQILSDAEVASVNEEFDAYVLPLANAFRPEFVKHLIKLTSFIERLTIPTIVTGVGSQTDIGIGAEGMDDETKRETIRFVSAVLNHAPSIEVRGETTRRTLLELGFHNSDITIIGCPSLYDMSRNYEIRKKLPRLNSDSKISINHEWPMRDLATFYKANEQKYHNLTTIYQTAEGGEYILWGKTMTNLPAGLPRSVADVAYRENHLKFFTNVSTWKTFLSSQDFCFGVRLHGVIAALAAGTPGVLLPIDSRTMELSEYHALPHKTFREVMDSGKYLAEDIYDEADFSEFNKRMPENWDRYYHFLETSGLHHIHQPNMENPDYERLLSTLHPAPAIEPVNFSDPTAIAARFRWLWQDRTTDHWRPTGSFVPETTLDASLTHSPIKEIQKLQKSIETNDKKLSELRVELIKIQKENDRLSTSLTQSNQRVEKRLKSLETYREQLHQPFEKRLWAAIKRRLHFR